MSAPPPGVGTTRLAQVAVTGTLLVGGMVLGLAGQALIAFYFGAGERADALFLARDVSDLAAKALLTSQAVGVLVPLVLALRHREGQRAADETLSAVLTLVLLVGAGLAAIVAAAAGPLVSLVAPGFSADAREQSTVLLRLLAPTAPCVAYSALAVGALQARDRFGRAMLANIAGGLVVLVSMPFLVHELGLEGAALSLTTGAVANALCAWAALRLEGVPTLRAPWRRRDEVAEFARRLVPFLGYAAATQGSGVVLRIAASLLGAGLYAAFALANRLYKSVLSLLMLPVQQVLLPALSRSETGDRPEEAAAELVATLRYTAFVLVPVAAGLVLLSDEAVSVVFERGAFSAGDTTDTGQALAVFAVAILPTGLYTLLEQAAYARRRTALIVRVNVGLELVQAALYVPAVLLLGVSGIAAVATLAVVGAAAVYFLTLRPARAREHTGFVLRLFGAAAVMCSVVATVDLVLDPGPGLGALAVVVPSALLGAIAYVGTAVALGLQEPRRLTALVRLSLPSAGPGRR